MERGRIIVNNTDYTGSFVTPNPSEPPTKDLDTLEIEGEVYKIQGGGGSSGSAYSETVLWSGNSSTSAWASPVTMSLNDSIRKYDEIIVQFSDNAYGYAFVNIPTSEIPSDYAEKYFTNASFVYKNNSADAETGYILVTADDEIIGYTSTGTTVTYTKVIGRKFGGNLSPIIYSTDEREVGVWINNKPLYQKTVVVGDISGRTPSVSLGVTDVEMAILVDGSSYNSFASIPYVTGTDWNNTVSGFFDNLGAGNTLTFEFRNGQNYGSANNIILTFQYTKTTDVAGSGTYNTLGSPMQHYDGNEKVVGTWFGETLYERTLNVGSISSTDDGYVIGDKATLKIKDCVELYGKCTYELNGGDKQTIPLPNYNNSAYYIRIYYESDIGVALGIPNLNGKTGIWFEFSSEAFRYYNNDIYVTIRYTKTTD